MHLGEKISQLRQNYGWSQKELAQKIGVSTGTIAEWESEESSPSLENLSKLCSALSVTADSLISDSNDEENSDADNTTPPPSTTPPAKRKTVNKKVLTWIIAGVVSLLCVAGISLYFALAPLISATQAFEAAVLTLDTKNAELDAAVIVAETLITNPCLDASIFDAMTSAIADAKAAKYNAPEKPTSKDEIIAKTNEILAVDYSAVLTNLSEISKDYEISVQRYQLVNCPTEEYIIECLKKAPFYVAHVAATESNDPNGNLNKPGGYTAHVFFESELVDLWWCKDDPLIEKGTDAGGSIEVYTTAEDAEQRSEYLARFDGTATSSGSHTVVGTCVVRTSSELNATQQRNYEADIIAILTALPGEEITFTSVVTNETKPTDEKPAEEKPAEKKPTTTESDTQVPNTEPVTPPPETQPTETIDRSPEAVAAAERIANSVSYASPVSVKEDLISNYGFTEKEALYGVQNANVNWEAHASEYISRLSKTIWYSWCDNCSEVYGVHESCPICGGVVREQGAFGYTKEEVVSELLRAGFTESEATAALSGYDDNFFYDESDYKKP